MITFTVEALNGKVGIGTPKSRIGGKGRPAAVPLMMTVM